MRSQQIMRRLFLGVLTIVALAICVRLFTLRGLTNQIRIASGSMAPTLFGEHYELQCEDCGWLIKFDAQNLAANSIVCSNCGHRALQVPVNSARGQRVWVDKNRNFQAFPQRWQLVAFRHADAENLGAVKRIVGLPGEKIEIRQGDVYANGEILRKPMEQIREMSVLVHESRHRSKSAGSRWVPASGAASGWQATDSFMFAGGEPGADWDWLEYRHWRCVDNPLPRRQESAVRDSLGYNQSLSRSLNDVYDVFITGDLAIEAGGRFALELRYQSSDIRVEVDFGQQTVKLLQDGRILSETTVRHASAEFVYAFEFGQVDHRWFFSLGGRPVFEYPVISLEKTTSTRPFRIGGGGGRLLISELQVRRDIFYLHANGLDWPWTAASRLNDREYFLLGDNPPISQDSRHEQCGPIDVGKIYGRVLTKL